MTPRLELRRVRKAYPAVVANDDVSLAVLPGEIHAVLGENGAGKSTLMKIIYGVVAPDAGEVLWDGRPVRIANPAAARRLGIGMVFQHFSLFDTLTVAENFSVGLDHPMPPAALGAAIRELSTRYGLAVEPDRHVYQLSVGERQRVEIVRALLAEPRLLILDEPTSVLTPQAVLALFATLRKLAAEGVSILYISHKLEEIRSLCDAATVLRAGRVTATCDPRKETAATLARMMIGRELPDAASHAGAVEGPVRLAVKELTLPASDPFGTSLEDVVLEVRAGEIVGIAGVAGNGQRELLQALSGETTAADHAISLDGRPIGHLDSGARRALGIAYVPEDRLGEGSVPESSLSDNALLTAHRQGMVRTGFVDRERADAYAAETIRRFAVKASGPAAQARSLSGGNLQKFIVGRELGLEPRVLVAGQPTWGVDVGAASLIRSELVALRARGAAVVVVSEELEELLEIADRIAVMYRGRLSAPLAAGEATAERIGLLMAGAESLAERATE